MNIAIAGLWHLGSITAACMARHHRITGFDSDTTTVEKLRSGHAPLYEPELDERIRTALAANQLLFTTDPSKIAGSDLLWVCYDTPVDADDNSDVSWVEPQIEHLLPTLHPETVVLISSQLPVGTCARLSAAYPDLHFACSPENLRLGKAIASFEHPARIVVGASPAACPRLEQLFAPLKAPIIWMRPASAEMVKHALNSFLALSVAYANEIATLAETVGADAQEIAAGLKSDPRIGPQAYLAAGGPFAGGTLARDVVTLINLGREKHLSLVLIPSIKDSNDRHRGWAFRKIQTVVESVPRPLVAVLGLAYTPNTNTLRRSGSVELCRQLHKSGVQVQTYDPLIRETDAGHRDISPAATVTDAMRDAHAVVICTACPEFLDYDWPVLIAGMAQPVMIDPNRWLEKAVAAVPDLIYLTVGKP